MQDIWDPDNVNYSWAAAGYMGAISTGKTTCGLLVGSTIAIGLKHGVGYNCIPLDNTKCRDRAIAEVTELYRDFIDNFGATTCAKLINCDFGKPGEHKRYHKERIYNDTCIKFFDHVMKRFIDADRQSTEKDAVERR